MHSQIGFETTAPATASALRNPRAELAKFLSRRSVSPRRLTGEPLSREVLNTLIDAALRAPDHGRLLPWRWVEFSSDSREALADLFEAEKLSRDPLAGPQDIARTREHATHPSALLAFVLSPKNSAGHPLHEQMLCAGAALGNVLMAAHMLELGASILSGERCASAVIRDAIGVAPSETLAGFVSIGRVECRPAVSASTRRDAVWSLWTLP